MSLPSLPTVSFKKISNPGDRPGSLPSYRMSARALPGKLTVNSKKYSARKHEK